MATEFHVRRKRASRTRKLPFLPRFGVYLDIAGFELIYKRVPFFESFVNLLFERLSPSSLERIEKQQLAEVQFPNRPKTVDTINTTHRTISVAPHR